MSRFPFSHSSLNQYITCPRQYQAHRVTKEYAREEGEEAKWGNDVHTALEERIGAGVGLPERMKQYEAYAQSLSICNGECEIYVELELGVKEDGTACDFNDPDCWARGIVDYLRIRNNKGLSIDHKTGKRKEGSKQLMMSAGLIFANFPELQELICGYAWLQEGGRISREKYEKNDCGWIWESFSRDLAELEWSYKTDNWPTRPSGLCRKWCSVLNCIYNGRGKR
jgi:hypothetical protein